MARPVRLGDPDGEDHVGELGKWYFSRRHSLDGSESWRSQRGDALPVRRIELDGDVANDSLVGQVARQVGRRLLKGRLPHAGRRDERRRAGHDAGAAREGVDGRGQDGRRLLGDGQAAETYAKAYGEDAEFYAFYRSLGAYRASFDSPSDVILLGPDNDFFRYFKSQKGGQ